MQDSASQAVTFAADALQRRTLALYDSQDLRVLELGSGCGIVTIMLALQRPDWDITGIEIQAQLNELSRNNAAQCPVRISFEHRDLRQYTAAVGYDLIISNPPWIKAGCGIASPNASRSASKMELHCTVYDVCECIGRNLTPNGQALLIYPRPRDNDVRNATDKSFLDIIGTFVPAETDKYIIYQICKRGYHQ